MQTIINVKEAQQRKTNLLEELKNIEKVLTLAESFGVVKNHHDSTKEVKRAPKLHTAEKVRVYSSRIAQARALCEEHLRAGNKVTKATEFLSLIKENGVELSIQGLRLALKSSKIHFDRKANKYKLRK